MIPNLYWSTIPLGPVTLQVWGMFVAGGIVAALAMARRFAQQRNLQTSVIIDAAFWIVLAAMIGSRLWFVLTEWQLFTDRWIDVVKIWQGGLSVSGGYVGAAIAGVWFFKKRQVSFWQYADVLVYALPLGMGIGRLGCFFIFDHPGTATDFFLGEVYFGDNVVRHNHGLYLALDGFILFGIFAVLQRLYKPKAPFFLTIYLLWEGALRLWLDFYRIFDTAYYGLKAAQWAGIIMIVSGLVIFGQRQNIRKRILHK